MGPSSRHITCRSVSLSDPAGARRVSGCLSASRRRELHPAFRRPRLIRRVQCGETLTEPALAALGHRGEHLPSCATKAWEAAMRLTGAQAPSAVEQSHPGGPMRVACSCEGKVRLLATPARVHECAQRRKLASYVCWSSGAVTSVPSPCCRALACSVSMQSGKSITCARSVARVQLWRSALLSSGAALGAGRATAPYSPSSQQQQQRVSPAIGTRYSPTWSVHPPRASFWLPQDA